MEQIKFKYEFGKHFDQIHSFLFELDFWEITELIGEEFDRKISFKSKNDHFVLNCKLDGNTEIYSEASLKAINEYNIKVSDLHNLYYKYIDSPIGLYDCKCDCDNIPDFCYKLAKYNLK